MNDTTEQQIQVRIGATIACCALAAICEGFDLQAAGLAAAGISGEFKPAPNQLGTFFSASTFGLFIGAIIGGRLSDTIGRKVVLVGSIAAFGLFCLLTSLAWDINSLTWARLLTGLGLGGAFPNLVALISEISSVRRRSFNVTMIYSGMPFGGAVASLLAFLIPSSHWRWIFIVGGVAPLIIVPFMAFLVVDSPAFRPTAAASSPATTTTTASVAMPKAGSFLAILQDGRALPTLLLWLSFFMGLLTLYLLLNWLPTLLVGSGLTKPEAAGVQIGFNLGGSIAALGFGYLLESRIRRPSVVAVFIAMPLTLLWLSVVPSQLGLIVFVVTLLGCFVLSTQAFMYSVVATCYPASIRGVGVGLAIAIGRTGSVVGPKLGGILKGMGHNTSQLLQDIVPLAVIGSLAAITLLFYKARSRGDAMAATRDVTP